MSKAVVVLVTRRELLAEIRATVASTSARTGAAPGAPLTVQLAGAGAIAREIAAAHRRLPSAAVVVVADDPRGCDEALAAGADEVVATDALGTLESAVRRARLRGLARDREAPDARVLGQVLSNVVRRLEAPSTALTLDLESLRAIAPPTDEAEGALEALTDCDAALEELSEAVRDASLFTRAEEVERPARVDVADVAEQALRVLGGPIGLEAIIERTYEPGAPPAHAARGKLARAVATAIVHALADATIGAPEGALRRLRVGVRTDHASVVRLEIEASTAHVALEGRGPDARDGRVAEDALDEPLLQLRARLRELDGDLDVEREAGRARLELSLPREPLAELSIGRPSAARLRVPTRPRVLLIDPDDRVLRATSRALADAYEVFVARNGEEAIDAAKELEPSAIVLNVRLPDVTASLLIDELRRLRGGATARIVLVAGQGELDRHDAAEGDARVDKPIRRADLLAALEGQLARRSVLSSGRSSPVLN